MRFAAQFRSRVACSVASAMGYRAVLRKETLRSRHDRHDRARSAKELVEIEYVLKQFINVKGD
jgi:hypothetical protein